MQVYAQSQNGPISAKNAVKHLDYLCPECFCPVRLQSSPFKQPHFFHPKQSNCRQSSKGIIHLKCQLYIQNLLGEDTKIEELFLGIGRIANVAHHQSKRVFEIQHSPISLNEAKERSEDYRSIGYTPIWILHEAHFNKRKKSEAERYLRAHQITYYSNFDEEGDGVIYDQEQYGLKFPLDFSFPTPLPKSHCHTLLTQRTQNWPRRYKGDLFDHIQNNPKPKKSLLWSQVQQGYLALLNLALEKISNSNHRHTEEN